MTLYTFQTPNFEIRVLTSSDRMTALQFLRSAWAKHAQATGADPDYFDRYSGDVGSFQVSLDTPFYSDGYQINIKES